MTALASIERAGVQTTIQDIGRRCARHLGTPQSGAADRLSLALANIAVGNEWMAPALECAMLGPTLRFEAPTTFALAGADMKATLNDAPVALYAPVEAAPGDLLSLGPATTGMRCYIAFAGGIAGDAFLDSASTYLTAAIGGFKGRALEEGDELQSAMLATHTPTEIPTVYHARYSNDWVLRACDGPEIDLFKEQTIAHFFQSPYQVSQRTNRMGVQLLGEKIATENAFQMKSSPVFPGTIQCPDGGEPFLLGADAQTLGGYPRIAQIIDADLPLIGQLRPSDRVWFRHTTPQEARKITKDKTSMLSLIADGLHFR